MSDKEGCHYLAACTDSDQSGAGPGLWPVQPIIYKFIKVSLRYINVPRAPWTAMEINKFQHPKSGSP